MATLGGAQSRASDADNFFRILAIIMAFTVVAGFSVQYLAGRSSFGARTLVHVHGLAFMAWVGLFVAQAWLATHGPISLHRRLGWILVLVLLGSVITIDVIQRGTTPFFFQPQNFLIANPFSAIMFAALAWTAIRLRRHTDWHMRLHICAMTTIIGPAFGRLLPMPLLIPYAFEMAGIVSLVFPVAGIVHDLRKYGHVHPAWYWGIAAVLSVIPVSHIVANSALGDAIYAAVTSGHPGADVPGMEFAPPLTIPSS
ncbi:MAG: hypothetical protein K9G27_06795 [Sphingomonadaceae bacterium]|nr:hypothetical protein [Sphingomonadaceae bacterium]